jgi:hypothetical protein
MSASCSCSCARCDHGEHGKCFNECDDRREVIITDRCADCREYLDRCTCQTEEEINDDIRSLELSRRVAVHSGR